MPWSARTCGVATPSTRGRKTHLPRWPSGVRHADHRKCALLRPLAGAINLDRPQLFPLLFGQILALNQLGIVLSPGFTDGVAVDVAQNLAVLPDGRIAAVLPIALRELRGVLYKAPGSHHVAAVLGGPVVENDLVENEPPLLVIEVVDLHEINLFPGHILLWRKTQGNNNSANGSSKGTHQSPPCCR